MILRAWLISEALNCARTAENGEAFRRRSTVKSVTDLPVGACYRSQRSSARDP